MNNVPDIYLTNEEFEQLSAEQQEAYVLLVGKYMEAYYKVEEYRKQNEVFKRYKKDYCNESYLYVKTANEKLDYFKKKMISYRNNLVRSPRENN